MSKGSISSYDGPQCDDDDEDGEASKIIILLF